MYATVSKGLRREQGFTLIELVVVLFILGLLIAIALPSYNQARQTAAKDEARGLGQEWRTLEWSCWLTLGTVTGTAINTCNTDTNIGFAETGVNWNFASTTLPAGATVYTVSPSTGAGVNIQVIRCAQGRTNTNVSTLQYETWLTVSGTANNDNTGANVPAGAAYDKFVPGSFTTGTCP